MSILIAGAARADLLVLDSGESLSGTTIRVAEGTLVFRTTLAGQMMVPMDQVYALTTAANLFVGMADETVHYGRLAMRDKQPRLLPLDGREARPIDLAQVNEAIPIPSPPGSGEADYEARLAEWRATIEAGVQWHGGNRDHLDLISRLELSRKSETSSFESDVLMERADPDDFPSFIRGEAELRGRGDRPLQPYLQARAERDTDAALDLRAGLSLGVIRPLLENGAHGLDALAGLDYTHEEWDPAPLRSNEGPVLFAGDSQRTTGELNLQLGLRYSRALFGSGTLNGDVVFYPALTNLGDLRARSQTALTFPLSTRLRLRLDLLIDFDNQPEFHGLNEWDAAVGASVRVAF